MTETTVLSLAPMPERLNRNPIKDTSIAYVLMWGVTASTKVADLSSAQTKEDMNWLFAKKSLFILFKLESTIIPNIYIYIYIYVCILKMFPMKIVS